MKGRYGFSFGTRLFSKRVKASSRSMTPDEIEAFDKVFEKMRETFKAMDEFFVAITPDTPPRPAVNEGKPDAKGSNHDG